MSGDSILSIYLLVFCYLAERVDACGGLLQSNNGTLDIEPSQLICLWIIKLSNMTGIKLELEHLMEEPISVISNKIISEDEYQSIRTTGDEKTYSFSGKVLAIVAPPGALKRTIKWEGMRMENDHVSSTIVKYKSNPEGTLEWVHSQDGMEKILWAVKFDSDGKLSWTLDSVLPECGYSNPCESIAFTVLQLMPSGSLNVKRTTCEGSSVGSLETETTSIVVLLLHVNSPLAADSKLKVTWRSSQQVNQEHTSTTEKVKRITTARQYEQVFTTEKAKQILTTEKAKQILTTEKAKPILTTGKVKQILTTEKAKQISTTEKELTDEERDKLEMEMILEKYWELDSTPDKPIFG